MRLAQNAEKSLTEAGLAARSMLIVEEAAVEG